MGDECRDATVAQTGPDAVKYVKHPHFPHMATHVPLSFTLATQACLRHRPCERPSFQDIVALLDDTHSQVKSGRFVDSCGALQV